MVYVHGWFYIMKIKDNFGEKLVSITSVVPLQGPKKEIEHFSLSLRLVSKSGEENVNS